MSRNIYIFAGGGTGGHIYPGLAVAEQLTRMSGESAVGFACSSSEIKKKIPEAQPYPVVPQPVRVLPRGVSQVIPFLGGWLHSAAQARAMINDLKPAAVLGLGGFAAAPIVRRAAAVGIRSAMLNPDAVPGRANRFLAGRVDTIFTQFESTAESFPRPARTKIRCVGCPVRGITKAENRAGALAHFALEADKKTLLVLGGSQGAATIDEAITALAGRMGNVGNSWQILHIAPGEKAFPASPQVHRIQYCDRMDLAYQGADLVLCRAGASTIAELVAAGLPAVLMPYPYGDGHQRFNALAHSSTSAAIVCEDAKNADENIRSLEKILLPLMSDSDRLAAMRQAAENINSTSAASDVAQWLLEPFVI